MKAPPGTLPVAGVHVAGVLSLRRQGAYPARGKASVACDAPLRESLTFPPWDTVH